MRDASRKYAHRHDLLSTMEHAALVSMLVTRKSTNKIVRQHSASKDSPDLPTAHIPDISTPISISDVPESPHVSQCVGSCDLVDQQLDVRVFCVFKVLI